MYKLLTELEKAWCASEGTAGASRDEERWLADCFGELVDRALHQLRLHRDLYPALLPICLNKLVNFCFFRKGLSRYRRMLCASVSYAP